MAKPNQNYIMTGGVWRRKKRVGLGLGRLMLLAGVSAFAGWALFANLQHAQPLYLAESTQQDVPVWIQALGTVQPAYTAKIRAKVTGEITALHVVEGQNVQKGTLLASIDPTPYQSQLNQFEAELAQDQAQLEAAQKEFSKLKKRGPNYQKDRQESLTLAIKQFKAAILSDEASIEQVQQQLADTQIIAPVEGRVGLLAYQMGDAIAAGNNLAEISKLQPAKVVFTLNQQQLGQLSQYLASNQGSLAIEALDTQSGNLIESGALHTADNKLEEAKGGVTFKAIFDNQQNRLWPGTSVQLRAQVGTLQGATVIPASAVLTNGDQHFIYVADKRSNSVDMRPVAIAMQTKDHVAIKEGIQPGEKVVLDVVSTRLAELSSPDAHKLGALSTAR